jgi:hypothetical protein
MAFEEELRRICLEHHEILEFGVLCDSAYQNYRHETGWRNVIAYTPISASYEGKSKREAWATK